MSKEINIKAQERFGEAANTGNFDIFDEVVASDAVDHDPAPGQGRGPEGFKHFFGEMRRAFPDFTVEVDHMTATDDDVAIAYRISGTHDGEFNGVAPTGKRVEARGCQISRFENGKLVERWGSSDELGLMSQLGVEPKEDKGMMEKLKDGLSGSNQ